MQIIRTRDGGFAFCSAIVVDRNVRNEHDFFIAKLDSNGGLEWEASYRGFNENNQDRSDHSKGLLQFSDGGFIVVGWSGGEPMVVRCDSEGEVVWISYLEPGEGELELQGLEFCTLDADENIIVGGNYYLAKLNLNGEVIWRRQYRGSLQQIISTIEGDFLVTGMSGILGNGTGDFYATKIDNDGEIIWENAYGSREFSEGCGGAVQTADGGWCLVGSQRFGVLDSVNAMAVRIDADGNEIWQHVYSELGRGRYLRDVTIASDGEGFVIAGIYGYLCMRIDLEGEIVYRTGYRGANVNFPHSFSIVTMDDGGYILCGAGIHDAFIVRTEPDPVSFPMEFEAESEHDFDSVFVESTEIWEASLFNTGRRNVEIDSVALSGDASVFAFDVDSSLFIERGDTVIVRVSFSPMADSIYSATLTFWYDDTSFDVALTGRGKALDAVEDIAFHRLTFLLSQFYPNPFNRYVHLNFSLLTPARTSIRIYDQLGHQVAELYNGRLEVGLHSMSWNAAGLPTGAYLCRIEAGGINRTHKLMLVR